MGKQNKDIDEKDTYEVWILYADEREWRQVIENGDPVFANKARALLIAQQKSGDELVVETMVVKRQIISTFNGEAIGLKHRLKEINQGKKKEEKPDAQVHGDRT